MQQKLEWMLDARSNLSHFAEGGRRRRRRATNVGCCSVGLEKSRVMHGQIQLRHIHNSFFLSLSLVLHINRQEARVFTFSVSTDLTFLILQNISKRLDSRGIL